MQTSHEEADVIIPQQVLQAVNEGNQCVKVICDDTDVFILLMYFYHQQKVSRLSTVLLESTGSTRSIICIGSTVKIHEEIVPYLPAANRLTGCDSVPMMFGIGKIKVCAVIAKSPLQLL